MGDKRGSGYINLGALYGIPRLNASGLPRPDPTHGPLFVSHEVTLQRDLAIINARTLAELGPLLPGGLPAAPKRGMDAQAEPLPKRMDYQITERDAMKINQIVTIATITGGLLACEPSTSAVTNQSKKVEITDGLVESDGDEKASFLDSKCRRTIFQCTTKNDKQVLVCDLGDTLSYSFGKAGSTPEIVVSVPRSAASTSQWKGVGRWIYYSVTIPNGNTKYTVFTSLDRSSDSHEFESGISVDVNGDEVAKIECRNLTANNLTGIDLKEE
jgi:hypothetical protein